jgi:hypothetical protein
MRAHPGQPISPDPLPNDAQRRHFPPLAYGSLRETPALTDTRVGHFSIGTSGTLFARR